MHNDNKNDRGQVGIGTLIVFIVMVLVAAIAAGVLINTAGFQQSSAEQTSQQSSAQVSDRLQEISTVGNVNNDTVDWVNVTVKAAPGAGDINLENVTVSWVGPSGAYSLTHSASSDGDGDFTTRVFKDASGTTDVLDSPDDRYVVEFNPGTEFGSALSPGDSVTIKLTTMAGGTTTIEVNVPESLSGKAAVEL